MMDSFLFVLEKSGVYSVAVGAQHDFVPDVRGEQARLYSDLGFDINGVCVFPWTQMENVKERAEEIADKKNSGEEASFKKGLSRYGYRKPSQDYRLADALGLSPL